MRKFCLVLIPLLFLSCANSPKIESGKVVAKFTEPTYSYVFTGSQGSRGEEKIPTKYFFCIQGKMNGMVRTEFLRVNEATFNTVAIDSFYYNTTGEFE